MATRVQRGTAAWVTAELDPAGLRRAGSPSPRSCLAPGPKLGTGPTRERTSSSSGSDSWTTLKVVSREGSIIRPHSALRQLPLADRVRRAAAAPPQSTYKFSSARTDLAGKPQMHLVGYSNRFPRQETKRNTEGMPHLCATIRSRIWYPGPRLAPPRNGGQDGHRSLPGPAVRFPGGLLRIVFIVLAALLATSGNASIRPSIRSRRTPTRRWHGVRWPACCARVVGL